MPGSVQPCARAKLRNAGKRVRKVARKARKAWGPTVLLLQETGTLPAETRLDPGEFIHYGNMGGTLADDVSATRVL